MRTSKDAEKAATVVTDSGTVGVKGHLLPDWLFDVCDHAELLLETRTDGKISGGLQTPAGWSFFIQGVKKNHQ